MPHAAFKARRESQTSSRFSLPSKIQSADRAALRIFEEMLAFRLQINVFSAMHDAFVGTSRELQQQFHLERTEADQCVLRMLERRKATAATPRPRGPRPARKKRLRWIVCLAMILVAALLLGSMAL